MSRVGPRRTELARPASGLSAALPLLLLLLLGPLAPEQCGANTPNSNLCLEDDYTNDLPIFIERRTICNYDSSPVPIYSIKITPDAPGNRFCLKGESAEKFRLNMDKELRLVERLSQPETSLRVQIIRTLTDIPGTPGERRQAINAIQFVLTVEECNRVSWQTILVAVLSSICVVLMSSLAIMLILYQQKGLIKVAANEDERAYDERSERSPDANLRDESFINPRRTSSYEFSSFSRHSISTLTGQETENV